MDSRNPALLGSFSVSFAEKLYASWHTVTVPARTAEIDEAWYRRPGPRSANERTFLEVARVGKIHAVPSGY